MNSRRGRRLLSVDTTLVEASRTGDQRAFGLLAEPYRHELQVHSYRMLGSVEDAEDAVQETLLRAWTKLDSFDGRGSFRAWLYGIATHACLDALRRRKARRWPPDVAPAADPASTPGPVLDRPWLQPYPDRLLDAAAPADTDPAIVATSRETIELAFLAALQHLPARQRAVLVLRDVLGWSAHDTAGALSMTSVAVNSALQRARETLSGRLSADREQWRVDSDATERALVRRLVAAWERADVDALITLLRRDARLVMPPRATWLDGPRAIGTFFEDHVFVELGGGWRLLETGANRQPAVGVYWRAPGQRRHRAYGVAVLAVRGDAIAEIAMFKDPALFPSFGLAAEL
jgi:RNA polymerase sigma-70 factor, ECF subfamily